MDRQPSRTVASCKDENTSASPGVDCVLLTCFDNNALLFSSMLGQRVIRLHRACTVEIADFLLLARGTALALDTTFLDGSWEEAVAMTTRLDPLVAALICADPIDGEFVASAQEQGAFGVIWLAMELQRLRSTIWTAHTATLERRLWLTERENEYRASPRAASGFCVDAAK